MRSWILALVLVAVMFTVQPAKADCANGRCGYGLFGNRPVAQVVSRSADRTRAVLKRSRGFLRAVADFRVRNLFGRRSGC